MIEKNGTGIEAIVKRETISVNDLHKHVVPSSGPEQADNFKCRRFGLSNDPMDQAKAGRLWAEERPEPNFDRVLEGL